MGSFLERLEEITPIQNTEFKMQIQHFIIRDFLGLTQEQRYFFILGGANTLLECHLIEEDDYYEIQELVGAINNQITLNG